jgi:release factor glutamine methyltransferase
VTRGELVSELAATLGAAHEARFIVDEVMSTESAAPAASVAVPPPAVARARALAASRLAGQPLQYLLGHWAFRTLDLDVDARVLIPRPETEQVVEEALKEVRGLGVPDPIIVDVGTGSGAIALSLAAELARTHPGGAVWAIDASADALEVATANLGRVRVGHPDMLCVEFVLGCWLQSLPPFLRGTVHLIVSNPPYVAETEWSDLPSEVRCEPRLALVAPGGSDGTPGLAGVEAVLTQAVSWLAPGGVVVIELASHQAEAAQRLARIAGFVDVRVAPDLAGRPRMLVGRVSEGGDS